MKYRGQVDKWTRLLLDDGYRLISMLARLVVLPVVVQGWVSVLATTDGSGVAEKDEGGSPHP
jgi:hypothetical protein